MTIFTICFKVVEGDWHVDKYLSPTKTDGNFIRGFLQIGEIEKVYILEKEELVDVFNIPEDVNRTIIQPIKKERKPRTKKA